MTKKKEKTVDVSKVRQEEGSIIISRTTFVSGKEVGSDLETRKIAIRPFICQPAYVSAKVGETVPLTQPYASKRFDINVSIPCYKEEILDMLREVTDFTKEFLEDELCKIENAALPRKKRKVEEKKVKEEKSEKKEEKVAESSKEEIDPDELDALLDSPAKGEPVEGEKPKEKKAASKSKKAEPKPKEKKAEKKKDDDEFDLDDFLNGGDSDDEESGKENIDKDDDRAALL